MPEIPGVTITFTDYSAPTSPRLLNMPDTSDRVVQDLIDTLAAKQAELDNLIYAPLIATGGKDVLNPTENVGLTVRFLNGQVKVADQISDTVIRIGGGNTIAVDDVGDEALPFAFSDKVNWIIAQSTSPSIVDVSRTVGAGSVVTGGTTIAVHTDLSEADGFWDGHFVQIANVAGTVIRRIDQYTQTNGVLDLNEALPFTPAADDEVLVLSGAHNPQPGS